MFLFKFGGKGMYGCYVYDVVIVVKEKELGIIVYFVDEEFDYGKVIV